MDEETKGEEPKDDLYVEDGDVTEAEFNARIDALPADHRDYALRIYANAVVSKLNAAEGG